MDPDSFLSNTEINSPVIIKFQIKRFDDPSLSVSFEITEHEDPDAAALEYLGYYVVPEISTE